ncbi:MAG: response regulator transcription factor [Rhodospirillales bacterium]|nr:response regulator transcription factor [Rhodospirillales bacterium]
MTIRVILADDHSVFREGLCSLLRVEEDIDVVGLAADGDAAIALVQELRPDVVVMDIAMPGCDGIEATERILAEDPSQRILALSMHADAQFMQKMFSVGAKGYLPKNCCFDELVTAIRTIHENGEYLSPSLNAALLSDYIGLLAKEKERNDRPLSDRETEVLKMIADGQHTKQIADLLCISVKTVETHRRQIMEKLGISTVAGLTRYAVRTGLVDL